MIKPLPRSRSSPRAGKRQFGAQNARDAEPREPAREAFRATRVLDRVPERVDAGRPFAMRAGKGLRQPLELVRLLERRIDQHQTAPLLAAAHRR